jgi:hypothetical protein
MSELMRNGGWPMYPILIAGGAAVLVAARAALRGGRSGSLRSLCCAVACLSIMGVALDLMAVCFNIAPEYFAQGADGGRLAQIVMRGFGESMSPAVLGFALLGVTGVLAAVGHARSDGGGLVVPATDDGGAVAPR